MSAIYIHVPFCAKRCIYCDFFSQTEMVHKEQYLHALTQEIYLRKNDLPTSEKEITPQIKTIYFGGGTPSQLSPDDLSSILDTLETQFDLSACEEITLEANPDDLTSRYLKEIRKLRFNRISLGVQSFNGKDLQMLNRRHSAEQAVNAIKECQDMGLSNISIDLIYGLPYQTLEGWSENLDTALELKTAHLSAYHLTYEEGTVLHQLLTTKRVKPVDEESSIRFYRLLNEKMKEAGYLHYEISSFSLPHKQSKHNRAYWNGTPYLGLGPSAHSYNHQTRQSNISSLSSYICGIAAGSPIVEIETLDQQTRYNEYIITRLRTMEGVDQNYLETHFGDQLTAQFLKKTDEYIERGILIKNDKQITMTEEAWFISDGILCELII